MKKYGFIAVFILLLVPVIWLMVLKESKVNSTKLPVYGERYFDTELGDTVYHTISEFRFVNQQGDTVTNKDFDNHIYVANFFFTSCPDICPGIMQNLSLAVDKYKNSPNVRFISHTVDPKRDSVDVLTEYAKSIGAKAGKWDLVTGSKFNLYFAGEHDYLLATVEAPIEDAFIHSEKLVLVDKDKRIRGFYDGTDYAQVKNLQDDIKALLSEYNHGSNPQ